MNSTNNTPQYKQSPLSTNYNNNNVNISLISSPRIKGDNSTTKKYKIIGIPTVENIDIEDDRFNR